MVHAVEMAQEGGWSFQDAVLEGLTDAQLRRQPGAGAHSIAWLLWHIARIEDVTMNLLVAVHPQVLDESSWVTRLGLAHRDVGTAMGDREVAEISARLDLTALHAYRLAVGRRSRTIAGALEPRDLDTVVAPERIQAFVRRGRARRRGPWSGGCVEWLDHGPVLAYAGDPTQFHASQ